MQFLLLLMHFCQREGVYTIFEKCFTLLPFIFKFFAFKQFGKDKTSDSRRVLWPENMMAVKKFTNQVLQFFDESPKQHVAL